MHINCLDLYASSFFILKVAMCDPHQYAHIRLLLDDTTAVAYVHHI